jgi:phage head maturation protease
MRGMSTPPATPQPYAIGLTFAAQRVQMKAGQPDPGAPVRFTGVAYSGGIVPGYGYLGDVAIDLASLQNPDAIDLPVLVDHDTRMERIAGKGALKRVVNASGITELHITGELTQATEAGRQIAALMAEGYPLQLSVGMGANLREVSEPIELNGQRIAVRHVFEQALIRETSFVPTGADPHTRAAAFSAQPITPPGLKEGQTTMSRTPEDQKLIDQQTTQLAAQTAQIAALQTQIDAQAKATRSAALSALFTEIGRDPLAADKAAPYLDMTDASFAAFAADLRAMHKAARPADRALFASQSHAMGGQPAGGASLMDAVKKLSA